jgi:hypothetical protein
MENEMKKSYKLVIKVAVLWIVFGLAAYFLRALCKENFEDVEVVYLVLSHIAFAAILLILLIVYAIYNKNFKDLKKEEAEALLRQADFDRKKEWEELQFRLNQAERALKRNIEKREKEQKIDHDEQKFQAEQKKEREDSAEIKKLKNEKWALEEELKKYNDSVVAEREKNVQAFHLLALALSDQTLFSENKTIEEKLKQIEKDYELLKETITKIKL